MFCFQLAIVSNDAEIKMWFSSFNFRLFASRDLQFSRFLVVGCTHP